MGALRVRHGLYCCTRLLARCDVQDAVKCSRSRCGRTEEGSASNGRMLHLKLLPLKVLVLLLHHHIPAHMQLLSIRILTANNICYKRPGLCWDPDTQCAHDWCLTPSSTESEKGRLQINDHAMMVHWHPFPFQDTYCTLTATYDTSSMFKRGVEAWQVKYQDGLLEHGHQARCAHRCQLLVVLMVHAAGHYRQQTNRFCLLQLPHATWHALWPVSKLDVWYIGLVSMFTTSMPLPLCHCSLSCE